MTNPSVTLADHDSDLPGYFASHWPCECAGPRRQKITRKPGLNIQPGERLLTTTRHMGENRWPAMLITRKEGELYVQGGGRPGQRGPSPGWIERIDPVSLATIARSPDLPSGGHNWCGAASVHANGDLYVVNGRYVHRLTPDLQIVRGHMLATDNAHNGHVHTPDGNLITKDIQIDPSRRSVFTVLDPALNVVSTYPFPWNSVGRFSLDTHQGRSCLYVTSNTHIHRLIYEEGTLRLDPDWSAPYAIPGEDQGFAWDSTISLGNAWFMDMGETAGIRDVLNAYPIGTNTSLRMNLAALALPVLRAIGLNPLNRKGGGYGPPIHRAPQRVFRVSLADPADCDAFTPFGLSGGAIIAPPLFDQARRILVAFDLMNAKLGAWRYDGPDQYTPLWMHDFMTTNQLTLFADTGELLVDDCKPGVRWDAVVLDIETGIEKARADTGCGASSGMWYTPGFDRDFYTSTALGSIARLAVS